MELKGYRKMGITESQSGRSISISCNPLTEFPTEYKHLTEIYDDTLRRSNGIFLREIIALLMIT